MKKKEIEKIISDVIKCTSSEYPVSLSRNSNVLTVAREDARVVMSGKIDSEGDDFSIAVNGQLLSSILSKVYEDDITLCVKDRMLQIKSANACIQMPGSLGDSVNMLSDDNYRDVHIPVSEIKKMVPEVMHVIDPYAQDIKLRSVCIETDEMGDSVSVRAVSSTRLAVRKTGDFKAYSQFTIEGHVLNAVLSVIDDNGVMKYGGSLDPRRDVPSAFINHRKHAGVRFCDKTYTIDIPLVDGEFFNISRLLQQKKCMSVTVKRKDIITAVELNALMNRYVLFDIDTDKMIVNTESEKGGLKTRVPAKVTGLSKMTIKLKSDFLLDGLKNLEEDDVTISLCTRRTPILFSSNKKETELLCPCL